MNEVIIIEGKLAGPTVCIIGGVHGNELAGIMALDYIKDTLEIQRGRVVLIYGNPRAIGRNVRYTEQNLNRMFRDNCSDLEKQSYEYQRSVYIRSFLDQVDVCLDLHASCSRETVPFAFTEANGMELASKFPVKYVCTNIDAFEKGSTDGYIYGRGGVGICVECGYLGDEKAVSVALECIETLLRSLAMADGDVKAKLVKAPDCLKVVDLYFNETEIFELSQVWPDFAAIPAGQIIGFDGEKPIQYGEDFILLFARNRAEKGKEAFLLLKDHGDV